MPAEVPAINLLGQEDISRTPQGRIISWALTYGRYIMIGTEIVVLLAFISRFSLDRKLTDLKEEIEQKQAILMANASLESDILALEDQLAKTKTVLANQAKPVEIFQLVATVLSQGTYLTNLDITDNGFSAGVVAATTDDFGQFLSNVRSVKQITKADIGDVKKNPLTGLEFKITASLGQGKKGGNTP